LRSDGTPYYCGKGKGKRAFTKGKGEVPPPVDISRIVIVESEMNEEAAFLLEIDLIQKYGRKDKGTGILRNKTDGGDGPSGRVVSDETKAKQSIGRTGKGTGKQTAEHVENRISKIREKKQTLEHIEAAAAPKRGVKFTKERCLNISKSLKGSTPWNKGKKTGSRSTESVEKQRIHSQGINSGPQKQLQCPHCGKIGGQSNMVRYHFTNCKNKG
jgi:hypothetical protein